MAEKAEKIIEFMKVAGELKNIERFRGQFFWKDYPQLSRYESVADHSWRMALLLVVISEDLRQKIDLAKALKMALIHDLAEVVTGDLSPLGSDGTGNDSHAYNPEKAKAKYENEHLAIKKILNILPKKREEEFYNLWMEYEKQENFESKVIKAIDRIEGKLQVAEYLNGRVFEKHLDFNLRHGVETFDIDPIIKELGMAINEALEKSEIIS